MAKACQFRPVDQHVSYCMRADWRSPAQTLTIGGVAAAPLSHRHDQGIGGCDGASDLALVLSTPTGEQAAEGVPGVDGAGVVTLAHPRQVASRGDVSPSQPSDLGYPEGEEPESYDELVTAPDPRPVLARAD